MNIQELQQTLNSVLKPSPNLRVYGVYGPRTEKAVRLFQAAARLGIDGKVGPITSRALQSGSSQRAAPRTLNISSKNTPWMEIAKKEIGQREIPGRQHNPRIVTYHTSTTLRASLDETPWCSSFVNWCMEEAGIVGTQSAAAISWTGWGKPCAADFGAITVIYNSRAKNTALSSSGNHVGFFVENSAKYFVLLGGNQSDQVKISAFPKTSWSVRGYRWPDTNSVKESH